MSAPQKPRGQSAGKPLSELTRFKLMWRDSMSEAARDFWRSRFCSADTQASIRAELLAKLKINLTRDEQLQAMRDWDYEQRALDLEAERQADEAQRIADEHPDWTKDQQREALLKRIYNRAEVSGDFALGLKTVLADAKLETLQFDKEKFKEGLRSKLEAGLAALAQHIKGNAAAKAAYDAFKATISETTK